MGISNFTAEELYEFEQNALAKAESLYEEGTIHPPLQDDEFIVTDIAERLNISRNTAQSRIEEMIENGDVANSRRASIANKDGHLRTKMRVYKWAYDGKSNNST